MRLLCSCQHPIAMLLQAPRMQNFFLENLQFFGANSTTVSMPVSFLQRLEESNDEVKGQTLPVQWLLSSLSAIICWRDSSGVTKNVKKWVMRFLWETVSSPIEMTPWKLPKMASKCSFVSFSWKWQKHDFVKSRLCQNPTDPYSDLLWVFPSGGKNPWLGCKLCGFQGFFPLSFFCLCLSVCGHFMYVAVWWCSVISCHNDDACGTMVGVMVAPQCTSMQAGNIMSMTSCNHQHCFVITWLLLFSLFLLGWRLYANDYDVDGSIIWWHSWPWGWQQEY